MPLDGVVAMLCAIPESVGFALGFALLVLWCIEDARPGTIGEWWERAGQWAVCALDRRFPDTERRTWR